MRLHSHPRHAKPFRPRVETLESRLMMDGTYSVYGLQFTVTENRNVDTAVLEIVNREEGHYTIRIDDNGTNNLGNVTVRVISWAELNDPGRVFITLESAISEIYVRGGPGIEYVTYNLNGDLQARRTVDVDLGGRRGGDAFFAHLYNTYSSSRRGSDLLPGSRLDLVVYGGDGAEDIGVFANRDTDIRSGAMLTAALRGGGGEDNIEFRYNGELDGTINLIADGGNGADVVAAVVSLDEGSTGRLGNVAHPARVDGGGGGADELWFGVHRENHDPDIYAEIWGDDDDDVWFAGPVQLHYKLRVQRW